MARSATGWSRADRFQEPAHQSTELPPRLAFQRRIDPQSRRGLNAAEFHSRQKRPQEDRACFVGLENKAFPDIEEAAQERLAVDRFLLQLDNPQLAFSIGQKQPSNLNEAITYTLEMQAHLSLSSIGTRSQGAPLPAARVSRNLDSPLRDALWQLGE